MDGPSPADWSFEKIGAVDPERANRLEAAEPPEALIQALEAALECALGHGEIRAGIDSLGNQFMECRVIIQFKVDVEIYDWFFNSRTGYRARFWMRPVVGTLFNTKIVHKLRDVLACHLPKDITARKIEFRKNDERFELDVGETIVMRDLVVGSLQPEYSKTWICERLLRNETGELLKIWFPILAEAESGPKLSIPRWASATNPKTGQIGEGLRAPCPIPEYAWLDLKGGFVRRNGTVWQPKPQAERSKALHEIGWT
jgi:hypothetical protein